MNSTSLYDMPKDMLIKLIATIKEDTMEEVETKMKECDIIMRYCSADNCKFYEVNQHFQNFKYLKNCSRCDQMLCKKHLPKNNEKCREECINITNDELQVFPIDANLFRVVNYGFIIRQEPDGTLTVISIEENNIRRDLTDDEKKIALNMGLQVL